jgi:transposase
MIIFWLESSLQIKRSMGIARGKTDKVDSVRIATYTLDYQIKIIEWTPKTKNIERLSLLVSHRDRLVKKSSILKSP